MKSVALLPAHGDPFMLAHFMRNYKRVWKGEVDDLYVFVSGQPDREACDYMRATVEGAGAYYAGDVGHTLDHGVALRMLAETAGIRPPDGVRADVLMLIESDARVRLSGEVRQRVLRIAAEADEVIGSPRVSMDGRLDTACREKWGRLSETTRDGCEGYGLWPCFVFVGAHTLIHETDRNYGARGWLAGETIEGLGIVCPEDGWCADTFGSAALQLRGRHRITADVQYKGPWSWREQLDRGDEIPWFHTGSLSSWGGSGGLTVDGDSELQDGRRLSDPNERLEWGHRIAWWQRFLRAHGDDLPRHAENYERNISRIMDVMGIPAGCVTHWEPTLDQLISWEER